MMPENTDQPVNISRKEHILNVAMQLFIKYGYNNISTDRIAREAKVSKGLIFHHFKSKDDLAFEILYKAFMDGMPNEYNNIFESDEKLSKDDLITFLKQYAENTLRNLINDANMILLSYDILMNLKTEAHQKQLKYFLNSILINFENVLTRANVSEAHVKTRVLGAIFDGLALQFIYSPPGDTIMEINNFIEKVIRIMILIIKSDGELDE